MRNLLNKLHYLKLKLLFIHLKILQTKKNHSNPILAHTRLPHVYRSAADARSRQQTAHVFHGRSYPNAGVPLCVLAPEFVRDAQRS